MVTTTTETTEKPVARWRQCVFCGLRFDPDPGWGSGACPPCRPLYERFVAARKAPPKPRPGRGVIDYGMRSVEGFEEAAFSLGEPVLYGLLTESDVAELERRRAKLGKAVDRG